MKVAQSRTTFQSELISILHSMIRSGTDDGHKKSTVTKLTNSSLFQLEIQNQIVSQLSDNFSNFLTSPDCSLKCQDIFSNDLEELFGLDLDDTLTSVILACPEYVNHLSVLCFNKTLKEVLNGENKKFEKQRLFTIINIAAFTRNQKINIFQKLLGNFCKKKNTSKQCLQLLQRLGVSLVPTSLRADEDKLGLNFLKDVSLRKQEIESWARVRENLETMKRKESKLKSLNEVTNLTATFFEDEICDQILDIEEIDMKEDSDKIKAEELTLECGSANLAFMEHIFHRPKLLDVTYDNIDPDDQGLSSWRSI